MFDNVTAIVRTATGSAAVETLFGALPDIVTSEILISLQGEKPQLRKQGGQLLVCLPIRVTDGETSVWITWVLKTIPPVDELQNTIANLRTASAQFEVARDQSSDASDAPSDLPSYLLCETIAGSGRVRAKAMRDLLVNSLVASGLANSAVAFDVKPATTTKARERRGRVKSAAFSNQSHVMLADELRALISDSQTDERAYREVENQSFVSTDLDSALLTDLMGGVDIAVVTPSFDQGGLAVAAIAPKGDLEVHLRALQNTYDISQRTHWRDGNPKVFWLKRSVLALGVLAFLIYAAFPVPMRVSTTVVSEPAAAVAETVPNEAFLRELSVAVGDMVEQGQVIAQFVAPQLEEQRNDILLQLKIEELTAQTALSEQDYAAFVLSEQNKEAQQERLNQINARLEALNIRASTSGRVIATMPPNVVGSFAQIGTDVAIVQPQDVFNIKMQIARIDAPFVERGQIGDVYFRGVADETYSIEVVSDITVIANAATQEDELVAWGRVTSPDVERLTTGLSGFAKIEVETRPRVLAWSRYVFEWIREKTWIYLDLRF